MALIWTLVPFMSWLGVIIMALVTLRKGVLEGFIILAWITLPSIVFAFLGNTTPLFYGVICGSLVAWILAWVLRETGSWSLVLQISVAMAAVTVFLVHFIHPDITQYWFKIISGYYGDAKRSLTLQVPPGEFQGVMTMMSKVATGIQAIGLLFVTIVNLILARWMQSVLFNPGGLAKDLYNLRLGVIPDIFLVIIIIAAMIGVNLAFDLLPIILFLFFVVGLSIIHSLAMLSKVMWAWLLGFYGLLILFFPYIAAVVIILAFIDSWFDLRQRFLKSEPRV